MKKLGLALMFLFLLATFVQAQRCDCSITPFEPKPKCFDECTTKILVSLKPIELQLIFDLSDSTAGKIADWETRNKPKRLEDYLEVLSAEDVANMMKILDSLNKEQLDYLAKPATERDSMRQLDRFKTIFANANRSGPGLLK
jgi:hypothetical protein